MRTRLGEAVRRPAADWRSLKLSKFEVHQVDSATIQGGDGPPVHLSRAGTDWKRDATVISFLPVSDLLLAVTSAKAEHLLSPREAQAQGMASWKPALTVELRTKDAGTETITLYPPAAGGAPARVGGRDTVLVLPADTLQKIQDRLKDVRTARGVGRRGSATRIAAPTPTPKPSFPPAISARRALITPALFSPPPPRPSGRRGGPCDPRFGPVGRFSPPLYSGEAGRGRSGGRYASLVGPLASPPPDLPRVRGGKRHLCLSTYSKQFSPLSRPGGWEAGREGPGE